MKTKLLLGLAGLLLASSTMFAGWGAGYGARGRYYAPRHGVYVGVAPGYHGGYYGGHYGGYYGYAAAPPYVGGYVAPEPYVSAYVGPAPYYGAAWFPGRWTYGSRGRYWARGYWGRRR